MKPKTVNKAVKGPQPRGRILIELRVLCADTHIPGEENTKKGRNEDSDVVRLRVEPLLLKDVWRTGDLTVSIFFLNSYL